jgi:hypothetical protein
MKTKAKFSTPMTSERSSGRSSVLLVWLTLVFVIGLCHPLGFAQEAVVLVGSGSSVPAPLYNKWAQEYNKRNPGIQMKYVPMGTSEGIKQISRGSGDFGSGEAQLTAAVREGRGLDRTAGRVDRHRSDLQPARSFCRKGCGRPWRGSPWHERLPPSL